MKIKKCCYKRLKQIKQNNIATNFTLSFVNKKTFFSNYDMPNIQNMHAIILVALIMFSNK